MTFSLEMKKILKNKSNILMFFLMCTLSVIITINYCFQIETKIKMKSIDIDRKIYKEYMDEFAGEFTEEKAKSLRQVLTECEEVLQKMNEIDEQYREGKINKNEYDVYNSEYYKWESRHETLKYIVQKCEYLESIGENVQLSYDIELETYLSDWDIDYFLIILILFIFTKFITDDYYSGLNQMIMATKNGKKRLVKSKIICMISSIVAISLFYNVLNIVISLCMLEYDNLGINIHSMMLLSNCFSGVSVIEYLIIAVIYKTIFYIVLGIIIMLVATILKKNVVIYGTVLAGICLPWYMYNFISNPLKNVLIAQGLSGYHALCNGGTILGISNFVVSIVLYISIACIILIGMVKRKNNFK